MLFSLSVFFLLCTVSMQQRLCELSLFQWGSQKPWGALAALGTPGASGGCMVCVPREGSQRKAESAGSPGLLHQSSPKIPFLEQNLQSVRCSFTKKALSLQKKWSGLLEDQELCLCQLMGRSLSMGFSQSRLNKYLPFSSLRSFSHLHKHAFIVESI